MNYQTFEPSNDLKSLIKCYWSLEGSSNLKPIKQTIVPDGCIEMIFHYGDLYKQYLQNGKSIIQPRCFVIGQLTKPLQIEATGKTGIFSVRFYPNGFLPLASIPIKSMENKAVSLHKLFGEEASVIQNKILNAISTAERINHIENFLIDKLTNKASVDSVVKSTVDIILIADGKHSIDEISRRTNINRRQLERKFSSAIGLSPKQLSKTIRLQATLKMLLQNNFTSLTTLAYKGDFYDQAHFIKDFKELTGYTPKEFYGDNLIMSSLFYGTK